MKRLKFPAMIIAVVVALAASAFTLQHKAKPVKQSNWYEFVGTTYDLTSVQSEANYEYRPSYVQKNGATIVSAILVPGSTDEDANPDSFDPDILRDLKNAFENSHVETYIDMEDE